MWIFDNFQILLVIGLALAAWLKNRAEAKEEEEAERRAREEIVRRLQDAKEQKVERTPEPQTWDTRPQDPEPQRQEPPPLRDILRDVMQSATGSLPETLQPQTTTVVEDAYDEAPAPWDGFQHQDSSHSEIGVAHDPLESPMLKRQREMQERLAEIKREAAQYKGTVAGARETQRRLEKKSRAETVELSSISDALKDKRQTRRAIILNEVLSKPIGLREMG